MYNLTGKTRLTKPPFDIRAIKHNDGVQRAEVYQLIVLWAFVFEIGITENHAIQQVSFALRAFMLEAGFTLAVYRDPIA